jgi:hypothetical protein
MSTRSTIVLALATLVTLTGCRVTIDATPVGPAPSPPEPTARAERRGARSVPFHDDLAPYGTWMSTRAHGWVWSPEPSIVGPGFMPYVTGGGWQLTQVGWMWTSVWDWGWAPFHYGRWYWERTRGWLWVPDTSWAPAWVDWRAGAGYVGWAPLPPDRLRPEIGEERSFWVFARREDLGADSATSVVLPLLEAEGAFAATTPVRVPVEHHGRTWYAGAPARDGEWVLKIKPPHPGEVLRPGLSTARTPAAPPRRRLVPPHVPAAGPARALAGTVQLPPRPHTGARSHGSGRCPQCIPGALR